MTMGASADVSLPGGPDGATVDEEDHLWSAQVDGACLIRYAPDGRMDRVVRLPGASHWVHHDAAERVTQLLIDFFAPALTAK